MYNQLIDIIAQDIRSNIKGAEVNIKIDQYHLEALLNTKTADQKIQYKVLKLAQHIYEKEKNLFHGKDVASYASMLLNDNFSNTKVPMKTLSYITKYISFLPKEEEQKFVEDYCQDDTISLLCQKVSQIEERDFYLDRYKEKPEKLKEDLKEKTIEQLRQENQYSVGFTEEQLEEIRGISHGTI